MAESFFEVLTKLQQVIASSYFNSKTFIATIYDLVAKSELDQEKADKLVGYIEKYIKAYETSELERRIQDLEDAAKK